MAQANYPLLVFPEPAISERVRRHGGSGKMKIPSPTQQAGRLEPQFQRLQEAMDKERLALQDNPLGIRPEQVLVLETIGPVEGFIRAVQRITGLEWLGEHELEDIPPEHGFQHEKTPDKYLTGRLFLVMTDQWALEQMRSLFQSWKARPDRRFPYGLAPLKHAFQHLYTIRPWGVEDRIRETCLLEDWRDRLEHQEDEVPFEAELWFRKSPRRRKQSGDHLRQIIESMDGQIVQQCVIPNIAYHAILGRLPRRQVQEIVDDQNAYKKIKILRCEDLMHARPTGQCAFPIGFEGEMPPLADHELSDLASVPEPCKARPVVALFDGLPMTRHRLLVNRLTVDDPDGYEVAYQAHERVHGTGMVSLVCHGDLNKRYEALDGLVYVRPIMQPRRGFNGFFAEAIPADVLPVDLIHRAVRRLFESGEGEAPVAPTVRIINLSIGDPARPFFREMSAWARLLDWLAWRYEVLFIVSAGNHADQLNLDVSRSDLRMLKPEKLQREVIRTLVRDTRNRRILSPAETLNGLTVGASHDDGGPPPAGTYPPIDPFIQRELPNVVSAHGPGHRRGVKPDILIPGGRQFLVEEMGTTNPKATMNLHKQISPPGQRVATPGRSGQLDRTRHMRGTSNAAALTTHWAGALHRLIDEIRAQRNTILPSTYNVVLTKALLAHGASWTVAREPYESVLRTPENGPMIREYLGRFLGYGLADVPRVMTCTEQRVTVLGFGELGDGQGAEFTLPLPPSLAAVNERRRLTITLAWISPVNCSHQRYRVAHLWFDPKNEIAPKRQFADHRAVQRGTLQHEVLEGDRPYSTDEDDAIVLKVNCRADAGEITEPVRFGLAVTLEVGQASDVPIYQEVRERLALRVRVEGRSA